jgi:hypothetical protein
MVTHLKGGNSGVSLGIFAKRVENFHKNHPAFSFMGLFG